MHASSAVPARSIPDGVLGIAACVVNAVAGQLVFGVIIGAAMAAVVSLDLGRSAGSAVYLVAIGIIVVAHTALIHAGVRLLARSTAVPWVIWPAMLVYPALMIAAAAFGAGVVEAFPGQVALVAVVLAFVSLGKRRWDV